MAYFPREGEGLVLVRRLWSANDHWAEIKLHAKKNKSLTDLACYLNLPVSYEERMKGEFLS